MCARGVVRRMKEGTLIAGVSIAAAWVFIGLKLFYSGHEIIFSPVATVTRWVTQIDTMGYIRLLMIVLIVGLLIVLYPAAQRGEI